MQDIYIAGTVRTPVGKFLGSLAPMRAPDLASLCLTESLKRSGFSAAEVDEVILGNVLSSGLGQNPARQALVGAKIPVEKPALNINNICASGLKSVMLAANAILAGESRAILAGGMENMSQAPHLLKGLRVGNKLGHTQLHDTILYDGLFDYFNDCHMGLCAEAVAEKYNISREEQDQYACESHRKAITAQKAGHCKDEILPVQIPQGKKAPLLFEADESPRADTTIEKLASLPTAFKKGGTVTAGNAPGVNDGAASMLVYSGELKNRIRPEARILGYAMGGVDPLWIMMAPVEAVRNLLKKLELTIDYFDLIEANEAFAVQALGVMKELKMDSERVNVNGGAVAIGHPIGASGARCLVTLVHALRQRGLKRGLVTLCLGGGNAVALAIETCD